MKIKAFPREALARNLRCLMDKERLSEKQLEKRSGVSQKAINKVLNKRSAPNLDTVEKLAAAFGIASWHLILPNLPDDLASDSTIERLVRSYIRTADGGRQHIIHVAEREAEYSDRAKEPPRPRNTSRQ